MAIFQELQNVVSMKALEYSSAKRAFVSPARPDFVWTPDGLRAAECENVTRHANVALMEGERREDVPLFHCTCGLFSSFDISIVQGYIDRYVVSTCFLVEASGKTVIHTNGVRSQEQLIRAVSCINEKDYDAMLSASQARDYFQIPFISVEEMIIVQDLWNSRLAVIGKWRYYPRSKHLASMSYIEVAKFAEKELASLGG